MTTYELDVIIVINHQQDSSKELWFKMESCGFIKGYHHKTLSHERQHRDRRGDTTVCCHFQNKRKWPQNELVIQKWSNRSQNRYEQLFLQQQGCFHTLSAGSPNRHTWNISLGVCQTDTKWSWGNTPSWKHLKLSLCFFLVLIFFRSQLMPVAALRTGQPYSPQLLSCSTQDKAQPALRPTEPISSAQVFSRWLYLADTMQFLKNKRFTIPLIPITRALCVPRKEVFLKAWQIRHAQSMRD